MIVICTLILYIYCMHKHVIIPLKNILYIIVLCLVHETSAGWSPESEVWNQEQNHLRSKQNVSFIDASATLFLLQNITFLSQWYHVFYLLNIYHKTLILYMKHGKNMKLGTQATNGKSNRTRLKGGNLSQEYNIT